MSKDPIRNKAMEFHAKIRREKLEAIFMEKRSRQQQRIIEFTKKQGQIKDELRRKFEEDKRTISEEQSTDELVNVWNHVRQNAINKKVFSQTSEQSRQQFRVMMIQLCNMVSLAVKQLNDYNQFQRHKVFQVVKGYKEVGNEIEGNNIYHRLMNRLSNLWDIFEVSQNIMRSLLEKVEKTQQFNHFQQDQIWLYYLEWCNIIVEMTNLKLPTYQVSFNSLIDEYKQLSFYSSIVKFTTKIKQHSLTLVYPACIRLIGSLMSRYHGNNQIKNGNQKEGRNQEKQFDQDFQRLEFVLGLFYVVGNILSDYQPNSIERHMQSLDQNSVLIQILSNPEQIHNLLFGISDFSHLLISLQTLRLQEYQKGLNFSYLGNQESYVSTVATIYKDYINLVEISIWFSRLLLIGGWLSKEYGVRFEFHQFQGNIQWNKTVEKMLDVIMEVSLKSVTDTVELIERMKIDSEQYIKKAAQYISQLILVYDLSVRQVHTHNPSFTLPHKSSQIGSSLLHLSISQSTHSAKSHQLSCFSIPKFIKKFTSCIVNYRLLKKNADLNLLNEIYCDLINLYETIIVFGMLDIQNCEDLVDFVMACTKGEIICSNALVLPSLVMRTLNNQQEIGSFKYGTQHLNSKLTHKFLCQLAPFIYLEFVASLQKIVPIFIYKNEKMIEEDEEKYKKTGKYNPEYMKKIYLECKSIVLKYFVENLSVRKQEEFYSGFIDMLKECFRYYEKRVTKEDQAKMVNQNTQKSQKESQLIPPCITTPFLVKFIYFIVDEVSKFDQTSPIHLQVLRFLRLVVSSFTKHDLEMETQLKNMIEYNAHGIKEYLEGMALWESQQLNEEVVTLFELLEIE